MGKHHAPRPRGYDPGGFKFPGPFLYLSEAPGTLFANDLAAPRAADRAPRPAVTAPPAVAVVALARRHGAFRSPRRDVERRRAA